MVDWTQVIIDVIDGIAFGIPSTILLQDVSKDYDIEIADLQRAYDILNKEYNNNAELRSSIQNKQYSILNSMYSMSPLGAWKQDLQNKYKNLSNQYDDLTTKAQNINASLAETSTKLAETQREANKTLGDESMRHKVAQKLGI